MENNEINEIMYGKEYVEKSQQFEKELAEIEKKHIKYFEARPIDRKPGHDLLHFHHITSYSNGVIKFFFDPDSDLDEKIKDECLAAFHRVYPEKLK